MRIPTYIVNLKFRPERKENLIKEFEGRNEFNISVVDAISHEVGAIGLWETIKHIIQDLAKERDDYILICEDDHQFTKIYDKKKLLLNIQTAKQLNADILLGGVSWFEDALQINEQLFWVKKFTGAQFMLVFKKFYKKILDANFNNLDNADLKISSLTNNKFLIYPFISIQKEFGYSDITSKNNTKGYVKKLFKDANKALINLVKVKSFYYQLKQKQLSEQNDQYNNIIIPTYIINLPERTERRNYIKNQFSGKKEFEITIIEACKHKIGTVGLWLSIRKIIELAIKNEDDVIVICEDNHQFTKHYSKDFFLKNVIEAHNQGADYLSGGTGSFGIAVPVSENRFWVNPCLSAQFIVVYKKMFNKILDEPFDDNVIGDILLSEMASNKMVLYPFISVQKDFGYSDVTPIHNENKGLVTSLFKNSSERLNALRKQYCKYSIAEKV